MRISWISILMTIALCAFSPGQETTPPETALPGQQKPASGQASPSSSPQAGTTTRIAPGSVIPVRLAKSIDAKKAKTGDEVEAKVTEDLKAGSGEVVVPKDTRVVGHITQAEARTKEQPQSEVGIAFDHAVMKDGQNLPLPMSIQAIIAPPSMTNNNSGPPSGDTALPGTNGGVPPATPNSGRSGMGSPAQAPGSSLPSGGDWPSDTPHQASNSRAPITGNTQGVVGLANLTLATNGGAEGSLVTSQKNNVKLDGGTLMLLRVNQ